MRPSCSSRRRSSDYLDLREARTLAGVAAEAGSRLVFGEGETAEPVTVRLVTANYFGLVGARPEAGRFFTEEESARRGEALVVLSDPLWRRRFGGRSDALGQTIRVGDGRYTIVGVTPVDFTGCAPVFRPGRRAILTCPRCRPAATAHVRP
ncbi:MAG TPA: ABC transporter permease [Vicinamibacterales bacterium]|nr:ABC transporter permease [Vicinamibacterales bacterium]